MRKQREALEHKRHPALRRLDTQPLFRIKKHAIAHGDPPLIRVTQAGDTAQQRAFSGSRRSDQNRKSWRDLKIRFQSESRSSFARITLHHTNIQPRTRLALRQVRSRAFIAHQSQAPKLPRRGTHSEVPPRSVNDVTRSVLPPSRPISRDRVTAAAASITRQNAVGIAPASPSDSNLTHI